MLVLRPTEVRDFQKAKYIRRWKGKDGKWNYEYPKDEKTSKSLAFTSLMKPASRRTLHAMLSKKHMSVYANTASNLITDLRNAKGVIEKYGYSWDDEYMFKTPIGYISVHTSVLSPYGNVYKHTEEEFKKKYKY